MKKFLEQTVWGTHAISLADWKYRNLKRVVFPVFDLLMILAGLSCVVYGVPTLTEFFDPIIVKGFGIALAIAAFLSLIGGVFLKRWRSEIIGVTSLFGLTLGYLLALSVRAVALDQARLFAVFFVAATMAIVLFRINLIGSEWQDRRKLTKR